MSAQEPSKPSEPNGAGPRVIDDYWGGATGSLKERSVDVGSETGRPARTRTWWRIAGLAFVVWMASYTMYEALGWSRPSAPPPTVEQQLLSVLPSAPFYQELKSRFPDDFAAIKDIFENGLKSGSATADAAQYLKNFEVVHQLDLVQAPDASLAELADQQALIAAMMAKEDIRSCGDFAVAGQLDAARAAVFSAPLLTALFDAKVLRLKAIDLGRREPTIRSPSETHMLSLRQGLSAAGLSNEITDALYRDGLGALSEADQCTFSVGYLQAVASMSDAESAYWTAPLEAPQ